jgi:hypothetical protein
MIGPTDLLHPSPTPHFKTFHAFLIYCPKRPSFSTVQSHAPNVIYVLIRVQLQNVKPEYDYIQKYSQAVMYRFSTDLGSTSKCQEYDVKQVPY